MAALTAYQAVLQIRTRARDPFGWAQIQNDLGLVLLELGKRDTDVSRLNDAVAAFHASLVRTRERHPLLRVRSSPILARR